MTEIERMHEERLNSLDRRVDVLSQKIDDYIAESRAARAETKEELKEMCADRKIFNQRTDKGIESLRKLMNALLIEVIVMDIAVIAVIIFK